jgi:hypothetical protein
MPGPLAGFKKALNATVEALTDTAPVVEPVKKPKKVKCPKVETEQVQPKAAEQLPTESLYQHNPKRKDRKPIAMLKLLDFREIDGELYYPTLVTEWKRVNHESCAHPMAVIGRDNIMRVICQLYRHKSVKVYVGQPKNEPVDPALERWVPVPMGE